MSKRFRQAVQTNLLQLRQRGSFAQNLAIAFSGNAVIAIMGVLFTPIMARIYPPSSYGLFVVFNSLVSNINVVSTFGYTMAFVLPRHHRHFLALVQLCLLLTGTAFIIATIALAGLHDAIVRWLKIAELDNWLYLVPVTVLVFNLYMIIHSWYLRTKDFRKRAGVEITAAVAGRGLTIGYGWLLNGPVGGLIIGDIFAKAVGLLSLLFSGFHRHLQELWATFSWRRVVSMLRKYREYPLYVLPASYLNTLAAQLPVFFLSTAFGTATVGLYAFSNAILELPINVIGNAVAPVSLQKMAELHRSAPERLPVVCLSLYNKLFNFGLLPFGIICVFGDWIFRYAFGARWEMAGLFTAYLGYYYMFKLASYSVGPVYAVLQRQRLGLLVTLLLVAVRAASLLIGARTQRLDLAMQLFGASSLVVTFGVDMHMLHLLGISVWRVALRSISLMVVVLGLLYLARLGLQQWLPV